MRNATVEVLDNAFTEIQYNAINNSIIACFTWCIVWGSFMYTFDFKIPQKNYMSLDHMIWQTIPGTKLKERRLRNRFTGCVTCSNNL